MCGSSAEERRLHGNHENTRFAVFALLIRRRMNRTVACLRHSNVRETITDISPVVHKQKHIDGISLLLRYMVTDKARYIGLSHTVCKDTCV